MQYYDTTLSLFNISRAEYNSGRYIFSSHKRGLNANSFIHTRHIIFQSEKILYLIYNYEFISLIFNILFKYLFIIIFSTCRFTQLKIIRIIVKIMSHSFAATTM